MNDPQQPAEAAPLPLQGPHWNSRPPGAADPASFFPLRLVLAPNGWATELTMPDMVLGRHSTADIRLHLPDVSRRHCRFVFRDGSWQVFDLQSMNGLYVNEERVEQATLHHRDQLRIGSYTFEIHLEAGEGTVPLPANGLNTLERIAGALPEPEVGPRRKAS